MNISQALFPPHSFNKTFIESPPFTWHINLNPLTISWAPTVCNALSKFLSLLSFYQKYKLSESRTFSLPFYLPPRWDNLAILGDSSFFQFPMSLFPVPRMSSNWINPQEPRSYSTWILASLTDKWESSHVGSASKSVAPHTSSISISWREPF